MEIINRKVKDLIPYDKNPRKNDEAVKYVKASIEQFGFKVPIVIDADGVIVAGHTRLKAAKELGMEEVPCIVADDLTPEQIKAYRLADNMTASKSEWDIELLNTELLDLKPTDMATWVRDRFPARRRRMILMLDVATADRSRTNVEFRALADIG